LSRQRRNASAWVTRAAAKLRFSLLGLATIKDIPTERFNELIDALTAAGWRKTGEYEGFDAWIDYGRVSLKKGGVKLKLEWDNWAEGSIEGPRSTIEEMARQFDFPVSHAWRWSNYDNAR
jgi:hypothetical protein